jgi:hypothetical protein
MNAVVTREFLHHMHLAHHSTAESIYVNIEYAGNIYIQYLSLSLNVIIAETFSMSTIFLKKINNLRRYFFLSTGNRL